MRLAGSDDTSMFELETVKRGDKVLVACCTAQMAFSSLLHRAAKAAGTPTHKFKTITVELPNFDLARGEKGGLAFELRDSDGWKRFDMPLHAKLAVPKPHVKKTVLAFGLQMDDGHGGPHASGDKPDESDEKEKGEEHAVDDVGAPTLEEDPPTVVEAPTLEEDPPTVVEEAVLPSGMRLGIVGYDHAPTNRAKCWVCSRNVMKNELRLWWRAKAPNLEKSMHYTCVSAAKAHESC